MFGRDCNFRVIIMMALTFVLISCGGGSDDHSSGADLVPVTSVVTLSGQVTTYGSSESGASASLRRALYTPVDAYPNLTSYSGANAVVGSSSISQDDLEPVKAMVSVFLLSDTGFTDPIATVKTDENGHYEVSASQAKPWILANTDLTEDATDAEVRIAIQALGQLSVRALIVKEVNGVKKALAIQSIADPSKVDSLGAPEPTKINPIVHRVTKSIVDIVEKTLAASLQSLTGVGLPQSALDSVKHSVLRSLVSKIEEVFEEAENDVLTIPEGQSLDDVVTAQENEFELDISSQGNNNALDALDLQISSAEEEIDTVFLTNTLDEVQQAEDVISEEDSTLNDSLNAASQGLLASFDSIANDSVANIIDDTVTANAGTLNDAEVAQIENGKNSLLKESLQKFFMSMGFAVIVDTNADQTAGVLGISLPIPSIIPKADIPGGRGFSTRQIRLFKVGDGALDQNGAYTSQASCTDFRASVNSDGVKQNPLYCATPLADVSNSLLTMKSLNGNDDQTFSSLSIFQTAVDDAFRIISDANGLPTANDYRINERVRLYHGIHEAMAQAPLVAAAVVDQLIENKSKDVKIKTLASVMANNFLWYREVVNLTPEGFPAFSGRRAPLASGQNIVSASELVQYLSLTLPASPSAAAEQLTTQTNFYGQFAPDAIQAAISRAEFNDGNDFNLLDVLRSIYTTQGGYRTLVIGNESVGVPPAPAYQRARERVTRGLTSAVPNTLFGQTLTSESEVNIRSALFLLNYLVNSVFLEDTSQGFFAVKDLDTREGEDLLDVSVPNFSNFKELSANAGVSVGKIVASLLSVTQAEGGAVFSASVPLLKNGLGSIPTLPEFEEKDIADFADDLTTSIADNVSVLCTVERFDGTDPVNDMSVNNLQLTLISVDYDKTNGQFEKGETLSNDADYTLVTGEAVVGADGIIQRTFVLDNVPVNSGQEYLLRFVIDSYRNDLPELFFFVDGYVPTVELCGKEFPLVLGPDQQFVPVPGLGLSANQIRPGLPGEIGKLEGIDISNFEKPGAPIFLTDEEETRGFGQVDFRLVNNANGLSFLGSQGVRFAPIYGGYVAGKLVTSLESAVTASAPNGLEPLTQVGSVIGASVRTLIRQAKENTALMLSSAALPAVDEWIADHLYLMSDRDGKYWILELRFIDIFTDVEGHEQAYIDMGIATLNSLGRVDIPDQEFDDAIFTPMITENASDPSAVSMPSATGYWKIFYGDWLVVKRPSQYVGPEWLEPKEISFDSNRAEYMELSGATDGIVLRYSSDDFESRISSADDIDTEFGTPPDFSSIPVTLYSARNDIIDRTTKEVTVAGNRFITFSYDKQSRAYVMSSTVENASTTAAQLKHGDIVAIYEDIIAPFDQEQPDFLARVIREVPSDDPYANFELGLEIVPFNANADNMATQKNNVLCFSDLVDTPCPSELPFLLQASDTNPATGAIGRVYDTDYDGVPSLFDPNDDDPNVPGSITFATSPSGGDSGQSAEGLQSSLVFSTSDDGIVQKSFFLKTHNIWPGEIDTITIKSPIFGDSVHTLTTCIPPVFNEVTGVYTDYVCTAGALPGVILAEEFKNGGEIGYSARLTDATAMAALAGTRVGFEYTVNFKAPIDFITQEPLMCDGSICPGRPALVGTTKVLVSSTDSAVLTDLAVTIEGESTDASLITMTSLDVGRPFAIKGRPVPQARNYELFVYCPAHHLDSFFPEESFSLFAQAQDASGRAISPSFHMDIPWLGGRNCDFTFRAMLESDSGQFVGVSQLKVTNVALSGGGYSSGFDFGIDLYAGDKLCFDGQYARASFASCEDKELTVLEIPEQGTDVSPFDEDDQKLSVIWSDAVQSAFVQTGQNHFAGGRLDDGATVSVDLNLSDLTEEFTCASVSSDFGFSCPTDSFVELVLKRDGSEVFLTPGALSAGLLFRMNGNTESSIDLENELGRVEILNGDDVLMVLQFDVYEAFNDFQDFDITLGTSNSVENSVDNSVDSSVDSSVDNSVSQASTDGSSRDSTTADVRTSDEQEIQFEVFVSLMHPKDDSNNYQLNSVYSVEDAQVVLAKDSFVFVSFTDSNQPIELSVRRVREDFVRIETFLPPPVFNFTGGALDLNSDSIPDVLAQESNNTTGTFDVTFFGTDTTVSSLVHNITQVRRISVGLNDDQKLNRDEEGNFITTLTQTDKFVAFNVTIIDTDGVDRIFLFEVNMEPVSHGGSPKVEFFELGGKSCCKGSDPQGGGILDSDFDGVPDDDDHFPNNPMESVDTDQDGIGDNTDVCLVTFNDGTDTDLDGIPDACEFEDDNGENRTLGFEGQFMFDISVSIESNTLDSEFCSDMTGSFDGEQLTYIEMYQQYGANVTIKAPRSAEAEYALLNENDEIVFETDYFDIDESGHRVSRTRLQRTMLFDQNDGSMSGVVNLVIAKALKTESQPSTVTTTEQVEFREACTVIYTLENGRIAEVENLQLSPTEGISFLEAEEFDEDEVEYEYGDIRAVDVDNVDALAQYNYVLEQEVDGASFVEEFNDENDTSWVLTADGWDQVVGESITTNEDGAVQIAYMNAQGDEVWSQTALASGWDVTEVTMADVVHPLWADRLGSSPFSTGAKLYNIAVQREDTLYEADCSHDESTEDDSTTIITRACNNGVTIGWNTQTNTPLYAQSMDEVLTVDDNAPLMVWIAGNDRGSIQGIFTSETNNLGGSDIDVQFLYSRQNQKPFALNISASVSIEVIHTQELYVFALPGSLVRWAGLEKDEMHHFFAHVPLNAGESTSEANTQFMHGALLMGDTSAYVQGLNAQGMRDVLAAFHFDLSDDTELISNVE